MATYIIRKGARWQIVIRDKTLDGFEWLTERNVLEWICRAGVASAVIYFTCFFYRG